MRPRRSSWRSPSRATTAASRSCICPLIPLRINLASIRHDPPASPLALVRAGPAGLAGEGVVARAEEPASSVTRSPVGRRRRELGMNLRSRPAIPGTQPPPQQRGPRPTEGDRLVFKMRIAPHWFDGNDRFWYRNDLAGGVEGVHPGRRRRGTRQPAFDHARLAAVPSRRRPDRPTRPIGSPSMRSISSTSPKPSASGSAT